MNYKILEVESRLFNRNIIQLGSETNAGDYAQNERNLIKDLFIEMREVRSER